MADKYLKLYDEFERLKSKYNKLKELEDAWT